VDFAKLSELQRKDISCAVASPCATWAELVALNRLTIDSPEALPAHANWSGLLALPKFFDGEQVDRRWRPRSPLGNLNNLERDDFGGRIGLCT